MKKHWHLHIRKLLYEHTQNVLLEDTHIELNPDFIYGVMGESGCGKTSLWESLINYPKPDVHSDIQIRLKEGNWDSDSLISLVPQQPAYTLNPVIKIKKSLRDVMKAHGKSHESELNTVIEMAQLEESHLSKYPHELSGGEIQRVAFALSLCMQTQWLILDEPTASLDKVTAAEILKSSIRWREKSGGLLIISSHDGHLLSKFCDRIILFSNQKLEGPFKTLEVQERLLVDYPDNIPQNELSDTNPILSLDDIHFAYNNGGNNFNLQLQIGIPEHSIIGITGRSGSGKSTLGKIMAGYITKKGIEIEYGANISTKFDIQYIPQDAILNFHPYQSMEAQLWPVYKKWNPSAQPADMIDFLESIHIRREWLSHGIYELSGGQRQRCLLARALFSRPKLLILDESFSALDQSSVIEYMKWIKNLYDEFDIAFLIISHDIRMLMSICQKVHVMSGGRLIDTIHSKENRNINISPVTNTLLQSYN